MLAELSATDPIAVGDDEFVSRLYISKTHSLLLTARWNGELLNKHTFMLSHFRFVSVSHTSAHLTLDVANYRIDSDATYHHYTSQ